PSEQDERTAGAFYRQSGDQRTQTRLSEAQRIPPRNPVGTLHWGVRTTAWKMRTRALSLKIR
ncbi:MAG TPA: hypothetical protein PLD47_13685, partial [Aggregatilineales bacterium]|nr:hypothetical protein [Aggregatilineales bacterium]